MSLHPFITALLASLKGRPAISAGSPEDARALVAAGRPVLGEGPAMARTQDVAIAGRSGSIPARLYRPVETPRGVIVYLREGSVGVVVPDALVDEVSRALAALDHRVLGRNEASDDFGVEVGVEARVEVVAAGLAKGLEFDHVLLLEPADVVAAEHDRLTGLRRLYVCLTRAVTSLLVLHAADLPAELGPPPR